MEPRVVTRTRSLTACQLLPRVTRNYQLNFLSLGKLLPCKMISYLHMVSYLILVLVLVLVLVLFAMLAPPRS